MTDEKMNHIYELESLRDDMIEIVKAELKKGHEHLVTQEVGDAFDMIKDACEAIKECKEACYFEAVTRAMNEYGNEPERYGYDNWRYASGKFAPKGHGTHTTHYGYTDQNQGRYPGGEPWSDNPGRMGYIDPNSMESSAMNHNHPIPMNRRYYQEGHTDDGQMIQDIREMISGASPELRKRLKEEVSKF